MYRPALPYLLPGALIFASRSLNSARWVLCSHSSLWDYAVRFAACKIPFEVFSLSLPLSLSCCESLKIHFMFKFLHVFECIGSSEFDSALNVNVQFFQIRLLPPLSAQMLSSNAPAATFLKKRKKAICVLYSCSDGGCEQCSLQTRAIKM